MHTHSKVRFPTNDSNVPHKQVPRPALALAQARPTMPCICLEYYIHGYQGLRACQVCTFGLHACLLIRAGRMMERDPRILWERKTTFSTCIHSH